MNSFARVITENSVLLQAQSAFSWLTTTLSAVCQLSPRFSLTVMNRSLALKITGLEETDLGLYYCVANVNTHFTVGSGAMLQGKRICNLH